MRGLSGHLHGPTLLCFWSPVMTSSVLPPSTVPWGKGPAPAGSPPPHLLLRLCLERAEASPSPESQNRTFQDSTGPVFHCGNCGQQQRDPCQPRGCPWPLGTVSGLVLGPGSPSASSVTPPPSTQMSCLGGDVPDCHIVALGPASWALGLVGSLHPEPGTKGEGGRRRDR
jgi:hypothetical protein